MSKFVVGDIAVIREGATPQGIGIERYIGGDVVIIEVIVCEDYGFNYTVQAADGMYLDCGEDALRKKRPPQDWATLCNLQDLPSQRLKELA